MPASENVMMKLKTIVMTSGRVSKPTTFDMASAAANSPKIAPDAPTTGPNTSANSRMATEPPSAPSR